MRSNNEVDHILLDSSLFTFVRFQALEPILPGKRETMAAEILKDKSPLPWGSPEEISDKFSSLVNTVDAGVRAERQRGAGSVSRWKIQRSYAAFVSHFKAQAGTEARLLKLECVHLLGVDSDKIFLDSDNLADLRSLKTSVMESDALVLLNTENVLSRPWCLVELNTALEHSVPIIVLHVENSYSSDQEAMMAALDDLPAYLAQHNPGAAEALRAVDVSAEQLGPALRESMAHSSSFKFNPHSSSALIEAQVKAVCQEIAAVAWPENARILAAPERRQQSVPWPPTGRPRATCIIFDEAEPEAEEQAVWLQRELARTAELGDNRCMMCTAATLDRAQVMNDVDTVLLVQTKQVLQRASCLQLLDGAIRADVPILPVKLLATRDATVYSHSTAKTLLENLETDLEREAVRALQEAELNVAAVGRGLADVLTNVISKPLDIHAHVDVSGAQLFDIASSLAEMAGRRGEGSTENPRADAS